MILSAIAEKLKRRSKDDFKLLSTIAEGRQQPVSSTER